MSICIEAEVADGDLTLVTPFIFIETRYDTWNVLKVYWKCRDVIFLISLPGWGLAIVF